jgi:hypothetical protein
MVENKGERNGRRKKKENDREGLAAMLNQFFDLVAYQTTR